MHKYKQVILDLKKAYAIHAYSREKSKIEKWKKSIREQFLNVIIKENKKTLLEIGAGVGRDSLYFSDKGLNVICTDLSPEMISFCKQKGLNSHELDFYNLEKLNCKFDVIYAFNCLLHLPKKDFPNILSILNQMLNKDGLLYIGMYGGKCSEGILETDQKEPKRFYSYYTNNELIKILLDYFSIEYFEIINIDKGPKLNFQSIILRKI